MTPTLTAYQLQTNKTVLTGDVTGSVSFDHSNRTTNAVAFRLKEMASVNPAAGKILNWTGTGESWPFKVLPIK